MQILSRTGIVTGNTIDLNIELINTYKAIEVEFSFDDGAYPVRQYIPSGIIKIGGIYGVSLMARSNFFGYIQFSISATAIKIIDMYLVGWNKAVKVALFGLDKIT